MDPSWPRLKLALRTAFASVVMALSHAKSFTSQASEALTYHRDCLPAMALEIADIEQRDGCLRAAK